MRKRKRIDPLPEHFSSIEEASDFWDTHDAGDYEAYLRPVREKLTINENLPQAVLLESTLMEQLKNTARKRGISVETLINLWLKERLGVTG
jgi:hypothetical protein